jgi:hypothetical protein
MIPMTAKMVQTVPFMVIPLSTTWRARESDHAPLVTTCGGARAAPRRDAPMFGEVQTVISSTIVLRGERSREDRSVATRAH